MRFFALLLLWASPAFSCGLERWPVKVLQDKDVDRVNTTPLDITVAIVNNYSLHSRRELMAANDYRLAPYELQVWKITGYVVGFKLEADEDFHIVISDLDDKTKTMIVEMPSGHCMPGGGNLRLAWEKRFGKATQKFRRIAVHRIKVQFTGYGFFDVIHGQTGVAKSGFELHPVTNWREVE